MSDQLLSVIIPYYRTPEELFRKCIGSVLSNDSENLEVIIVDDGSPEEDQEMLRSLAEKDPRVRLLFHSHQGVSAARNSGIRAARGTWISFVDSDDYVSSVTLARILENLSAFSGDVVLFGGGRDNNGSIRCNTTFLQEGHDYGKKWEDKLLIMGSSLSAGILPRGYYQSFTYGAVYCKLLNRQFLLEHQLYLDEEVIFAEDVLYLMKVYLHAQSIFYYNWYLYTYVNNSQSVTNKYRPHVSDDMKIFFQKMTSFLEDNHLFEALEQPFYLRAEFEAGRSRKLEFCHPSNPDRHGNRRYREFVRNEPFRTALKKKYLYGKSLKVRISRFLIRHRLGSVDRMIRKLHHLGDGSRSKPQSSGVREENVGIELRSKRRSNMTRIGILTFHRAINYGAVLQAYALQKTLQRLGADCTIIDFRSHIIEDYYKPLRIAKGISVWWQLKNTGIALLKYRGRKRKKKALEGFVRRHLKVSEPVDTDLEALNAQYDLFVTGSDQVFNLEITGKDAGAYLLSFAEKPRYSYAASFGKDYIREQHQEIIRSELSRFRKISVREESGVEIVSSLTGREAEVHIDPVMLLTAEDWESMETRPAGFHRPYILVYNMLTNEPLFWTAKILAEQKNLGVVVMNSKKLILKRKYKDFRYIDDISPEGFLWVIHHAEYVLSSSFHGTVLSLLFHKRFLVILPPGQPRNARMITLLQMAGIQDRIFTDRVRLNRIDETEDWNKVDERISFQREKSFRYAEEMIRNG